MSRDVSHSMVSTSSPSDWRSNELQQQVLLTSVYTMIELCNKKRMLLGIISLGGLTLIVLIVESHWTETKGDHMNSKDNSSKAEHCWQKEPFKIVKSCHSCSEFEVASKTVEACIPTNFKETVRCEKSGLRDRSCDKVQWLEEKKYWMFEVVMLVLAVVSYSVVMIRQHILDKRTIQKIQKQLANGLSD